MTASEQIVGEPTIHRHRGCQAQRLSALVGGLALLATLAAVLPQPAEASNKGAAMAALKVAKHYYKAKKFAKAAERFHEAFGIDPNPAFLFNAARAEMRAFKLDQSERHFKQYLGLKRIDAEGRRRARVHLDEVAAQRKVMAAQRRAIVEQKQRAENAESKAATATKAASASPKSDWLTVGLWSAGGAALATSGLLYLLARSARTATNDAAVESVEQKWEHDEQIEAQDKMRNISIGVAAVGVGLGAWALLRRGGSDDQAANTGTMRLLPLVDGSGLALSGRF